MKRCQVCTDRLAMRYRFADHPWYRCHTCHMLMTNKPNTNQERPDE